MDSLGGMNMWTAAFWRDAGERAIKTFAQALLVAWPVSAWVQSAADFAWASAGQQLLSMLVTATGAAILSLLMSVAGSYTGEKGTPQVGANTYEYEG
jgi:hypothetical protein